MIVFASCDKDKESDWSENILITITSINNYAFQILNIVYYLYYF